MSNNQARIAVTGMACRFPGASDIDEFWRNLVEGKDTVRHFSDDELAEYENDFAALRNNPDYVRARGIINDIDKFDAAFFGMTPNEAAGTDPQHRVWLETAWNALEDAGCDPLRFPGSIGVFAGGYINTYLLNNILRDRSKLENYIRLRTTESFQILTGNDAAFIPTKTAYKFNLRGPAVNVQTACSTSLVAISMACQSLFSYESDVCIAGGVCIVVPQESGYIYQKGAIPSPDGKCRPFDEKGNGTVFSNGIGVVVLKRLDDALRDHDRIYALVRGWAINNDGSSKVSYTAPSVEGQANAIMMAQSFSEVSPLQIGYIEAHGTATQLGDPIELTALNRVFSSSTRRKQFCGIGSVKSNIGHTDAAAGVASFIKSCLSAYHRMIPPTLHFTSPNPNFDLENSPFYVQDKLKMWDEKDPLIIGVSSFGIGGTNAHVIIEEPPEKPVPVQSEPAWPYLLPVSAKSEDSLIARQRDLENFMSKHGNELTDIAYTLQEGRTHMPLRSFCVVRNTGEVKESSAFSTLIKCPDQESSIVIMFSGQGAQYPGMGKELYDSNQTFRNILDECFAIFRDETGRDLKKILFGANADSAGQLAQTGTTQPALFIIEYALAKLYCELGIRPHYLIGHSIGEYAAACLSGVFDMKTALRIVIRRGSLMQKMPSGKMLAVRCSADDLVKLECRDFEIAADNAKNQCTISFTHSAGEKVRAMLDMHGMHYVQLNTSHAFHSSAFDPVMEEFESFVDDFQLQAPEIPFISCLTGKFITQEQAVSGKYWAQQLRNTVMFRKGISALAACEDVVFLEIGPDTHLTGLTRQNPDVANKNAVVSSLGKKDEMDERAKIISSLGYLWANGINVDFGLLNARNNSRKISLPGYPFQRKRCWIDHFPSSPPAGISKNELKEADSGSDKGTIDTLKAILCRISGYPAENIDFHMSFNRMGFDSLFLTQFARSIQENFGVKVEFRQLISEYSTLDSLSGLIDSLQPENKNITELKINSNNSLNNFVKFQPAGKGNPLVILHGQGADTIMPDWFGNDQPYYGFLHPGSDGEKIGFSTVEEMASSYLEQLIRNVPRGPYYLGGFSFGGILAYEMARKLEKMGHIVPCVLLFDSFALLEPFRWRNNIYRILRSNFLGPAKRGLERIIKMGVCELFIRLDKPTPLIFRNYYIIDRYLTLVRTFKPVKINSEVILFRATGNGSAQESLGWDKYIDNIKVIPVKGAHISILDTEENRRIVYGEMKRVLNSKK